MAAPVHTDPVSLVRAIWSAYRSGGPGAVRDLVGGDVEWVPLHAERALPNDRLFGDWGREQLSRVSMTAHGFEPRGECVLAHGSVRAFHESGFVDSQPSWVYFFRGGRLIRCVTYATREDALHAIAQFSAAAE